jgi:predicted DNA-binding transcriptional regulator AlpA
MSAPAKTNELDPLLHPAQVAKLLGVSSSWLAKSRLNGTGPRFIKIGRAVRYAQSAVRDFILSSIPMTETPILIETSFADAIAIILSRQRISTAEG